MSRWETNAITATASQATASQIKIFRQFIASPSLSQRTVDQRT
jgi:hypothetical protein